MEDLEIPLLGGEEDNQEDNEGDNLEENVGEIEQVIGGEIEQVIGEEIEHEIEQEIEQEIQVPDEVADAQNLFERTVSHLQEDLDAANAGLSASERNLAAAKRTISELEKKLAAGTQVTGVDALPYISLVYVLICMAFTVLCVFGAISDFKATDGTPVGTFIDAFYITSVMVFTVGFGDIVPKWARSMVLCDMISMFGGGLIQFILQHFVSVLAQWLYNRYLSTVETRGCRSLYLVISAASMILVIILSGMLGCYIFEWKRLVGAFPTHSSAQIVVEIFHLTVMTMTTVGYGDFAFATTGGRAFAAVWIPVGATFHTVAMSVMVAAFLGAISHCRRSG